MEPHGNTMCRYFARGFCKFGSRCRFSHNISVGKRSYHVLDYPAGPSTSQILQDDRPSRASTPESSGGPPHSPSRREEEATPRPTCGICLEDIKLFGILVNCCHCFCLNCIRGWRMRKEFATRVKQACPECRTVSEFVIPSKYWVKEDKKQEFVAGYKERVSKIDCKFFRQGSGWCRFQEKCLYRHKLPDGSDPDYSTMPRPRCHHRPLVLSDVESDDDDDEDYLFSEYVHDYMSSPSYSSLSDGSDFSSLDSDDNADEMIRLNFLVLRNYLDLSGI